MSSPDIIAVITAFLTLISRNAGILLDLPFIKEIVGTGNTEFFRIAAGAFLGSSSAGIIFVYFREKLYLVPLKFRRDHTIVCGLDYHSFLITRDLVKKKQKPVVIVKNGNNSYLASCKRMGVPVILGNPADPHLLKSAGAAKARYILSLADSDEHNAEVALQTMQLFSPRTTEKVTSVIQILDPRLFLIIRKQSFAVDNVAGFRIEFFNQHTMGAKLLLDQHPPLYRVDGGAEPYPVIIIGAGNLGETIISRMARTWFENTATGVSRPEIYLVDANAKKILQNLNLRFQKLQNACTVIPVELDIQSAEFQTGALLAAPALKGGFTAYICFRNDTLGIYTALTLHQYAQGRTIKIIVRIEENLHVARLISDEQYAMEGIREIFPVDMYSLTADSTIIQAGEQEYLARAIHENYCQREREKDQTLRNNRLLVSWEELGSPALKKDGVDGKKYQESNRMQAHMIRTKMEMIGCDIGPLTDWDAPHTFTFTPDEVETLAAVEHERWMDEKLSEGWSAGPERDDIQKIHPSLIPYEELSEDEKEKDRETIRQIPRILSLVDFQVYRRSKS